ncbi:1-phosphofructokinase [Nakamurella silvestris]|nr:1-phosphofructokinase [Nakamurella silvestris]
MIITVTPNPSIDRAFDLDVLRLGEVNRAENTHFDPGGKGINIARALANNGIATTALFPSGGPDGELLMQTLAGQGVLARPVPIGGAVRSNITLVEGNGSTTKVNAPGPVLTTAEADSLLAAADSLLAAGASWLVGAGSLPSGVREDFYQQLAGIARRHGTRFALDTSGPALAAAVGDGDLAVVKPNEDELAELLGVELSTVGDVIDGAHRLIANGIDSVLVSLGANGALLVTAGRAWWAGGPPLVPLSTVGAGDTTLAGYLATTGDPPECLRTAVAWGRAAVLLPGSAALSPQHVDVSAVRVIADPDPRLALKELT